jgi:hypothetical protein
MKPYKTVRYLNIAIKTTDSKSVAKEEKIIGIITERRSRIVTVCGYIFSFYN